MKEYFDKSSVIFANLYTVLIDKDDLYQNSSDTKQDGNFDVGIEKNKGESDLAEDKDMVKKANVSKKKP